MRSIRVELARLRSRRAVAVLVAVALGLTVLLAASAVYDTRPADPAEVARAQRQLEEASAGAQAEIERCREAPAEYFGDAATAQQCEEMQPRLEWFLGRSPLDVANERDSRGLALVVLLSALSILVGTTFAGADWTSGSMSNQLLFDPRRLRLWAAKAVAVVAGTVVVAAALLLTFWVTIALTAAARGVPTTAAVWGSVAESGLRGLILVAASSLGGYALTMLLRSTVGTLGLLFAYTVAGEVVIASVPLTKMSQWSVANNVLAWALNGTEVYDESLCRDVPAEGCSATYLLTLEHAAGLLGALLALAVVASLVAFRSRDVP